MLIVCVCSTGCQCTAGWKGTDCDEDVNECANNTMCTEINKECLNIPGNYSCRCKSGFAMNETTGNCESKSALSFWSSRSITIKTRIKM